MTTPCSMIGYWIENTVIRAIFNLTDQKTLFSKCGKGSWTLYPAYRSGWNNNDDDDDNNNNNNDNNNNNNNKMAVQTKCPIAIYQL